MYGNQLQAVTVRNFERQLMPSLNDQLAAIDAGEDPDNFLGFGKKAKAKRAIKLEKKGANVEIKKAKAYAMRTLADKGIQYKTGFASAVEGIGAALGGGRQAPEQPQYEPQPQPQPQYPTAQHYPTLTNAQGYAPPTANEWTLAAAGVGTRQPLRTEEELAEAGEPKKDNTFLYVGIAAAILVVIVLMMKK